jgi:hypothetical protein
MKALLLLITLWAGGAALAQPDFQVDLILSGKAFLFVDGAWQDNSECIEARVSVTKAAEFKDLLIKAYFYAGDGKLLEMVDRPSPQPVNSNPQPKPPARFEPGRKYSLYFAVPARLKAGASKWRRAVVVFGTAEAPVARIYPKDDLAKFDFPEKKSLNAK